MKIKKIGNIYKRDWFAELEIVFYSAGIGFVLFAIGVLAFLIFRG